MEETNSAGIYFLDLELGNYRCFKERQVLKVSDEDGNWKRWTVILGDNGLGKTTLLQLFAGFECEQVNKEVWVPRGLLDPSGDEFTENAELPLNTISAGINIYKDAAGTDERLELIFIGNDHVGFMPYEDPRLLELQCYGYGANRFMGKTALDKQKTKNSESLFKDFSSLMNAEEWLLQLDYSSNVESNLKEYIAKKKQQVTEILLDILPDITEIRFTQPTKSKLTPRVQFKTPFGWVDIKNLSLGYKSMIAWVVDLAARMFDRYPDSDNPLAEPAIVLVDEIDLHLHPKWQRKIFEYLTEKFPKTQFIVTAHSPLIVQSAPKDVNLVVLRKEGDHVVIDQNIENVRQWRIDQILTSDLFGLESSRSPEIEDILEERKELLQKPNLNPAEKERLGYLNNIIHNLPTADNPSDIEAMEIIRKAADYLKEGKK